MKIRLSGLSASTLRNQLMSGFELTLFWSTNRSRIAAKAGFLSQLELPAFADATAGLAGARCL